MCAGGIWCDVGSCGCVLRCDGQVHSQVGKWGGGGGGGGFGKQSM